MRAGPVNRPRVVGIMEAARDGKPTPSNPEMGGFWSAMKSGLTNLSEGRQSPAQAMDAAALQVPWRLTRPR